MEIKSIQEPFWGTLGYGDRVLIASESVSLLVSQR